MNLHSLEQEIHNFWEEIKQSSAPDVHSLYIGQKLLGGAMGDDGTVYAADFFRYAAEQGNVDAMYELAMCYRWGNGGVYAEPEVAMKWFRMAAGKGHEEAKNMVEKFDNQQGRLMLLYSAMSGAEGPGTKWYKTKAGVEMYYEKAQAGDAECQYELARQLANPERIGPFKHDIKEAIHWYTEAAGKGMIDAMFNLGGIYYKGQLGIERDLALAREWFAKCADAGDAEAKQMAAKIDGMLSGS